MQLVHGGKLKFRRQNVFCFVLFNMYQNIVYTVVVILAKYTGYCTCIDITIRKHLRQTKYSFIAFDDIFYFF